MKNLLLIILLIASCGKIRVDDIEIQDSEHTVEHVIIFEGNLEMFNQLCVDKFPDDEELQAECISDYMKTLQDLLDQPIGKDKITL